MALKLSQSFLQTPISHMASSFGFSLLLFSLLFLSSALAQPSFSPKSLLLPVQKDASTLQYITQIHQRTPLVPVNLTLDVGGKSLWVDCDKGDFSSTTYVPALCGSAECSRAGALSCGQCFSVPRPGCINNTCELFPENTVTNTATTGDLGIDVVTVQSTDGINPGRVVTGPQFPFLCAPTPLLAGLASGVQGMLGFGRATISLPPLFSSFLRFNNTFAICLSSSTSSPGVVFIGGNGPYRLLPNTDASTELIYTPLLLNPVSTAAVFSKGDASSDYFIGLTAIHINQKPVPIKKSLLSINQKGYGGTKISTVAPYTILKASIYRAVTKFFIKQLSLVPRVAAVPPFTACFNSTSLSSTRVGPGVPQIDLVLQNGTIWTIFGANSMVQVSDQALCLGFVDGGVNPRTSIVIGGHQIEDNLLQFDLDALKLGFSSSLLFRQTTCANFNFTSSA